MDSRYQPDLALEKRLSGKLLDVLIRFVLVLILAALCYRIFSPFLNLMVWAVILAVTLYPAQRRLAQQLGGRKALAATLLVLSGVVLVAIPTTVLMLSLGDSIHNVIERARDNTLQVPAPSPRLEEVPVIGKKLHGMWSQAHEDLPTFVQSLQPKIGDLSRQALAAVASMGGTALAFLASFIVAGIIMVFGEGGARASIDIFNRIVGFERGEVFVRLSTATIRAVALGVVGVAAIQAILIGLLMMVAGVPFAGGVAMIQLVLGIAQIPALLVTLPAIVYIWTSGDHAVGAAVAYSVLLLVAGVVDNVLKPLMLGRGVDAPMPVVLLGALGGLASSGILGMFVGAALLTLGYQIFMAWVAANPDATLVTASPRSVD
ncbi:MAG TPA: AI-2E family transporter [Caldimonas sp.]|nr:AI-2E family transporter [Caldimonas sp.]